MYSLKYVHKLRYFYKFVGAGLKPARYGNGTVRKKVEAKNEPVRAGFKPAPTNRCPNASPGFSNPGV